MNFQVVGWNSKQTISVQKISLIGLSSFLPPCTPNNPFSLLYSDKSSQFGRIPSVKSTLLSHSIKLVWDVIHNNCLTPKFLGRFVQVGSNLEKYASITDGFCWMVSSVCTNNLHQKRSVLFKDELRDTEQMEYIFRLSNFSKFWEVVEIVAEKNVWTMVSKIR